MFETILCQEVVTRRLCSEIDSNRLPRALLFHGEPTSGKSSTALELARYLMCAKPEISRHSECNCHSCARHDVLAHPDLLLLGPISHKEEVLAAIFYAQQAGSAPIKKYLVRSIRKLLGRFNPALWQDEHNKLATVVDNLREVEEDLADAQAALDQVGHITSKLAEKLRKNCEILNAAIPAIIPLFMVRGMESWLQLTSTQSKVAILHNADRMQESSSTALLKTLEEVPAGSSIILLTRRKAAILETIVSRTSAFFFHKRAADAEMKIIEHNVGAKINSASLLAFFEGFRTPCVEELEKGLNHFVGATLLRAIASSAARYSPVTFGATLNSIMEETQADGLSVPAAIEEIARITKEFGNKDIKYSNAFDSFLVAFVKLLRTSLKDENLCARGFVLISQASQLLNKAHENRTVYNINAMHILEQLSRDLWTAA